MSLKDNSWIKVTRSWTKSRVCMYLYVENISSMLFGYAFWFILFRITDPETVGTSSSLICFATIFVFIASAGVH